MDRLNLLNSVFITVTVHVAPRLLNRCGIYHYAGFGTSNLSTWDLVVFWMWSLSVSVPEFYENTFKFIIIIIIII